MLTSPNSALQKRNVLHSQRKLRHRLTRMDWIQTPRKLTKMMTLKRHVLKQSTGNVDRRGWINNSFCNFRSAKRCTHASAPSYWMHWSKQQDCLWTLWREGFLLQRKYECYSYWVVFISGKCLLNLSTMKYSYLFEHPLGCLQEKADSPQSQMSWSISSSLKFTLPFLMW